MKNDEFDNNLQTFQNEFLKDIFKINEYPVEKIQVCVSGRFDAGCTMQFFMRGETIIRSLEPTDCMYLLLQGGVRVETSNTTIGDLDVTRGKAYLIGKNT